MKSRESSQPDAGEPASRLADWLAGGGEEEEEFEALCGRHPGQVDELRRLRAAHAEIDELLGEAPEGHLFSVAAPASTPLERVVARGDHVGAYRLGELVGRGGMGEVWVADQPSLERRVALKLIRPDRVNQQMLELFAREARAGGRLSHPGIVGVHEHGESDGIAWIAMELVEGARTLSDVIDGLTARDALVETDYRRVAELVTSVAEALQAAHVAGVIHRDVKPSNILLGADDRPRLSDFGLARIVDETALSRTGDFAGTVAYSSPEQVLGKRAALDHRTDIFSLGAVLYELLTLRRPFEGDTAMQVVDRILHADPPDPRSIRSRVPRDLAIICAKCMEKEPSRRYGSMEELVRDLQRHLAHEPIAARPASRWTRTRKWIRRHPLASAVSAVAATALTVITVLSIQLWGEVADVKRLSAMQRYEDLLAEADEHWPIHPANISAIEDWLARARALRDELPGHRAMRDRLRARALPRSPEDVTVNRWRFAPDDGSTRWWHAQFDTHIQRVEAMFDPEVGLAGGGIDPVRGWGIGRRLAHAIVLRDGFATGGEFAALWEEARAAIATLPVYESLDPLEPQMGLVPLGPDPESGLWEFWHVASGVRPERDEEGWLVLTEESGVVLVLLPGGRFWMGATRAAGARHNFDPQAQPPEGPVHEHVLSPFFIAKYELAQGPWLRLTGSTPSVYGPDGTWDETWSADPMPPSYKSPIEMITWFESRTILARFGLALPAEAQWEYAARGGVEDARWTGPALADADGAINLADLYAWTWKNDAYADAEKSVEDGFVVHAPVDALLANPFGLYHVLGNVWEWCEDDYVGDFYAGCVATPARLVDPVAAVTGPRRVTRGGTYRSGSDRVRSAYRHILDARSADSSLGVRPARPLR